MTPNRREFMATSLGAAAVLAGDTALPAQTSSFPGFEARKIQTSGATINVLRGGSGPPLLLIHGYPQTHVEWHKIAARLARKFIVMVDLRGYGDSSKPPDGENQPGPFPETLIGNSAEFYLRSRFLGAKFFAPEAIAEYLRAFKDPATIHATCEDYRAGATIDITHAEETAARKVTCPLLVLWGQRGLVGRIYDVMKIWREHATHVTGQALPGGHFLPEELPDETYAALFAFL